MDSKSEMRKKKKKVTLKAGTLRMIRVDRSMLHDPNLPAFLIEVPAPPGVKEEYEGEHWTYFNCHLVSWNGKVESKRGSRYAAVECRTKELVWLETDAELEIVIDDFSPVPEEDKVSIVED